MRRLAATIFVSLALWAGPPTIPEAEAAGVAQLERVAVVNVQRCLLETRQGKKAKKQLEKAFSKGQARLDRKAKDLQRRVDDLRAKASMLSNDEVLRRQQALVRTESELQQLTMELQEGIMEKEALLTEKIYKRVATIVKQIALEEKIQVVIVRSEMTVLFASPRLDVTNRVILQYNKKYK